MKWRRVLRGWARASAHLGLVALPVFALLRGRGLYERAAAAVVALAALGLLVRAAFVYIAGFDLLLRIPWRGPRRGGRMAITFDDGPNGAHTREVLRLLDAYAAKATFFVVGRSAEREPEIVRDIEARGHALGSHTYTHAKLNEVTPAAAIEEIDRGHAALLATGVADRGLFRAPHGQKTFAAHRHLRRRGLRLVAWTAGVFDTDCPSPRVIFERARRWVRPGAILLLHDGKQGHERGVMTEALEQVLRLARERGVRLVTVPELLGW
jgi:peptidoglycan/xylan/chitin deacetylase (PgdA/CDA1 family)